MTREYTIQSATEKKLAAFEEKLAGLSELEKNLKKLENEVASLSNDRRHIAPPGSGGLAGYFGSDPA